MFKMYLSVKNAVPFKIFAFINVKDIFCLRIFHNYILSYLFTRSIKDTIAFKSLGSVKTVYVFE